MHAFSTTIVALMPLAIADWFALTMGDLERLATVLLGERPGCRWVRHGDKYAVVASLKLGSLAPKLDAELSALTTETRRILAPGGPDAALRAAAFYHLRFENIHPLLEGNGRVGRTIMAAQLHQTLHISVEETLSQVNAHENDYKMVFPSGNPELMFELMLDVLSRLSGHVVGEGSSVPPASLLPLYPDRRPLIKNPNQPDRPLVAPSRPPRRGSPPFRKFR